MVRRTLLCNRELFLFYQAPAHTCPLGRGFGAAGYRPTRRLASRAEGAADGHVVGEGVGELADDVPIRGLLRHGRRL